MNKLKRGEMYQVHRPTIFLGWQAYLSDFMVDTIDYGNTENYYRPGIRPGEYDLRYSIRSNVNVVSISFSLMAYGNHSNDAIDHFLGNNLFILCKRNAALH